MKIGTLSITVLVSLLFAACESTSEITSEERPPVDCGNRLVIGIACEGRFCDEVTVDCGEEDIAIRRSEWIERISEEEPLGGGCFYSEGRRSVPLPEGKYSGVVTGLSCGGHFCDDIFLRCSSLDEGLVVGRRSDCFWTDWVSDDESGDVTSLDFPVGYAATSMRCRGSNCDDKRFYLCRLLSR